MKNEIQIKFIFIDEIINPRLKIDEKVINLRVEFWFNPNILPINTDITIIITKFKLKYDIIINGGSLSKTINIINLGYLIPSTNLKTQLCRGATPIFIISEIVIINWLIFMLNIIKINPIIKMDDLTLWIKKYFIVDSEDSIKFDSIKGRNETNEISSPHQIVIQLFDL